jgi:hypothetical protein
MHVYDHTFFESSLPGWLDEGFAIAIETRVTCGDDPRRMEGGWHGWNPGDTDGHPVGSELFRRLEMDYGCGVDCAAEIWRDLVDTHGDDPVLTAAEIKQVFEARIGSSLSGVFATLGIAY